MLTVDDIPCAMMVTDPQGHVVRLNRELLALVGGEEARWRGRSMDALLTPASRIFSQTHLFPTLHHAAAAREIYIHLIGADGEPVPVMVNAVRTRIEGIEGIVWAVFVARERSRFESELIRARSEAQSLAQRLTASNERVALQNQQLSELSQSDPLTGLRNRRALELAAQQWQQQAGESATVAVLMVDVDHFKRINDLQGHLEGDRVLVALAQQLQASARGSDLVVRYGGEEFLLWLPDADVAVAEQVAERIHERMRHVCSAAGSVTVSIGLAGTRLPSGNEDVLPALVRRADDAVYEAKARGRNCTAVMS
jgi:diguanylate cyclase (GGDEF)-like protein